MSCVILKRIETFLRNVQGNLNCLHIVKYYSFIANISASILGYGIKASIRNDDLEMHI